MPARTLFLVAVLMAFADPVRDASIPEIPEDPILGGTMIVAKAGHVTATFLGSDAAYRSRLYLDVDSGPDRFLFSNKSTPLWWTIDLGWFDEGTELTFRLVVWNTRNQFFTGPGTANPDGLPHALADTIFDASLGLYVTDVGFEDLFGGGDEDYNDFMFRLTNVYDPPPGAPEPATLALLGLGLAGLGAVRRKRTAA